MKKELIRYLLCLCLLMIIMGGCGKDSEVTSEQEGQEETNRIEETDASALEESTTETETGDAVNQVIEFVEPAEKDFEYYDSGELGGIIITRYNGEAAAVRVPDKIEGLAVKSVSITYNEIVRVELPDSVVDCSFEHCPNLTEIILPDGVTSIKDFSFSYCSSLRSITIPDSVTSIGRDAFSRCESLTAITLPDSVTSIDQNAFFYCSNLTSITIPDGIIGIESSTFVGCNNLMSITIPDSVTYIGEEAFFGCGFTSIIIPDSVTSIEEGAFAWCSSLTSITIPDSVTSIGDYVFCGCEDLKVTYQGQEYTIDNDPANWWVYY